MTLPPCRPSWGPWPGPTILCIRGHASAPKNDGDKLATAGALRAICEKLLGEGVVSCFSLGPSDDVALACAFVANGFRRTGLLQNHMVVGNERKDAIIWSRKLANPADE